MGGFAAISFSRASSLPGNRADVHGASRRQHMKHAGVILLFSVDQYPKSSLRRLACAVKGPRTLRGTPSAGRLEYEGGFSLFYCGFGSGPVEPHWPAAEPDESASGPC